MDVKSTLKVIGFGTRSVPLSSIRRKSAVSSRNAPSTPPCTAGSRGLPMISLRNGRMHSRPAGVYSTSTPRKRA